MVKKGKVWNDSDFTELNWNLTRLGGLMLPGVSHELIFLLDYALRNPMDFSDEKKWELVPVSLTFYNVVNLKIEIDLGNYTELDIVHISREWRGYTPNGKLNYWHFRIDLNPSGIVSFLSTSFNQTAIEDSEVTENYSFERESKVLAVSKVMCP